MTGALLCSFGVARDEFVEADEMEEEGEGEEEGTPEGSRSPPFMARTEWPTLVSRLLGFGDEFSEGQKRRTTRAHDTSRHCVSHVIQLLERAAQFVQ